MPTNTHMFHQYLNLLPDERKEGMKRLRQTIIDNLPEGFVEKVENNGISYTVPHSLYPDGYHCDPRQPLPFISIRSQKNFIALYHMGIYANKQLYEWFTTEYGKHSGTKLDMGKSCIRFKKADRIPFELIGELVASMTPQDWIAIYESNIKR